MLHVNVTPCIRDLPGKCFLVLVPTHPSQQRFCSHKFPKHIPHQVKLSTGSSVHSPKLGFWGKKTHNHNNHKYIRVSWQSAADLGIIRGTCGHSRAARSYQPQWFQSIKLFPSERRFYFAILWKAPLFSFKTITLCPVASGPSKKSVPFPWVKLWYHSQRPGWKTCLSIGFRLAKFMCFLPSV